MKPYSSKRAAQNREYAKRRKAFLESHPWCEVWLKEHDVETADVMADGRAWKEGWGGITWVVGIAPRSTEIHHMKGRGKYLLDESTWLAVGRENHERIEKNKKWAESMGFLDVNRNSRAIVLPAKLRKM